MNVPAGSEPTALDVLIVDLQGNLRGKRLPLDLVDKALNGGTRLPLSTQLLDIWGDDCDRITGQALSRGDPDGACIPTLGTLREQPWRNGEQQVLCSLYIDDETPSPFDPRTRLASVDDALNARGLTAVVAVELEFYIMDAATHGSGVPTPPGALKLAGDVKELQLYDLRVRDRLEPLIDRIERYAVALDIPVTTSLLEFGPAQVEINLQHRNTALQAADDAVLFKRLVDRAAFDEGFFATFMAKPYTEAAGCGMHTHISLVNESGHCVFDNSDSLLHACAGVLDHLPEMLAVMAPHMNSWRRLQPDSFAPTRSDWGYDHRGVAVRLPETSGAGARLEQRVAGADANPYLVLTAMLSAVIDGIDQGITPSVPALQAGEKQSAPTFTHDWRRAIDDFGQSEFITRTFGKDYQQLFTAIKKHEASVLARRVSDVDWQTYLPQL